MRIGIINLTNLARVRETFRLRWRIVVAVVFLLFVGLWWGKIHRVENVEDILADDNLRPYTVILIGSLALILIVALFLKNAFARLLFAFAATFVCLSAVLFLLVKIKEVAASQNGTQIILALVGLLVVLLLSWAYLIPHIYALCRSSMPFGRWTTYRQQVNHSLRLWSGHWKGPEEPQEYEASEEQMPGPISRFRLALGGVALALGLLSFFLLVVGLLNVDFYPAIFRGDFSRAWEIIRNLEIKGEPSNFWEQFLGFTAFALFGLFNLAVFGYFWNQRQRSKIPVYRTLLSKYITPSSLLALRSSKDDVKFLPGRTIRLRSLLSGVYAWNFTFEELIVERLARVGKVHLLVAGGIKKKSEDKSPPPFLRRLQSFVKSSDLTAKGGIRYLIDDDRWQEEIKKAVPVVRMIILLLGTTDHLKWEMNEIKGQGSLVKTVFLMPPHIFPRTAQERWQYFVEYICQTTGCKKALLKKVDPRRVLAVCFRENDLVVITGTGIQLYYESALDIATILTIAGSTQPDKMIPKYLNIGTL